MTAEDEATILVVDDDLDTCELCRRVLRRHGYEVACVHTLADAESALDGGSISLIILDYSLPDGPPWPLIDRANKSAQRIPVIMATGMGDERVAVECLQRGADDYITKAGEFWSQLPGAIERARQLNDAQEYAARLAAVVSASHDPIISADRNGLITSWNEAATALYGWDANEIVGRPLQDIVPDDHHAELQHALQRVLDGERAVGRIERRNRSGEIFRVTASQSPIIEHGQVVGIAIVEQDLSPFLRTEELEQRTSQLEKLNEELDQFASVAAHDLQAPLATTNLSLEMLSGSRNDWDDGQQALFDQASGALASARRMIRRILEYARQSTISLGDDHTILTADAVEGALDNLAEQIRQTQPQLQIDCAHRVRFDPVHLTQIFQNLVGNALHYADPDRPPVVHVRSIDGESARQGFVRIEVRDNGRGMSAEALGSIFRLFQRGDDSGTGGTGIGLAICKKLVEARGGKIDVESTPGSGTTFVFTVPEPNSRGSLPVQAEASRQHTSASH